MLAKKSVLLFSPTPTNTDALVITASMAKHSILALEAF
jgi:hypothetical protein